MAYVLKFGKKLENKLSIALGIHWFKTLKQDMLIIAYPWHGMENARADFKHKFQNGRGKNDQTLHYQKSEYY